MIGKKCSIPVWKKRSSGDPCPQQCVVSDSRFCLVPRWWLPGPLTSLGLYSGWAACRGWPGRSSMTRIGWCPALPQVGRLFSPRSCVSSWRQPSCPLGLLVGAGGRPLCFVFCPGSLSLSPLASIIRAVEFLVEIFCHNMVP